MKTDRIGWIVLGLLIFGVVSCVSNLEVRKKQEEASRNLGEVYLKQGDYTLALREFLKAEQLYPQDPFLHYDLGLAYRAKDKPDLSIKHFKKALELNPDYGPARNGLGTAYLAEKDWDEAIAQFKEVAENLLYSTPHIPLSNLGLAYYNKGEYQQAEKYYLKALEIKPDFINALLGLGRTYMELGKLAAAVDTLENGVRHYPDLAATYFDLGRAYRLKHEYSKAFTAFGKVIELAPDTDLARAARAESQKIKNLR
jgi:type IV pilus assembly protein PilF